MCHLKTPVIQANSPIPSPIPADDSQSNETTTNQRQTRGFRVHIDTKTHRVTRTNKKIKLENQQTTIDAPIKQEPVEINNLISEFSSSSSSSSSTTAQAPSRGSSHLQVFCQHFSFVVVVFFLKNLNEHVLQRRNIRCLLRMKHRESEMSSLSMKFNRRRTIRCQNLISTQLLNIRTR